MPRPGAFIVGNARLRGDVPLAPGGICSRQSKHAHIGRNQRVHPGALERFQMRRETGNLIVAGHCVHRAVNLHAPAVGVFHCVGKLSVGKVSGKGAHPKAGARQIYCVRPVGHGHFQPLHIPCGAKQLRKLNFRHTGRC
ncbi:hypothetical protein SDC9_90122 [bioreactor metagenome]|uniref:Uncharacterized protein n=1 Tax=bioreactor metagenome TaxID=1076179 RepID=A0A644ZSS3_9ZZZZ